LKAVAAGASDTPLIALYFQFGRYLLISSSRPGTMAANLQGIWNESLAPPWESKYTININIQMNYWPAEVTNLSALHAPLFDLIDRGKEDGRRVISGGMLSRSIRPAPVSGRWARRGSACTSGTTTTTRATGRSFVSAPIRR
jgi:hypothetical protein